MALTIPFGESDEGAYLSLKEYAKQWCESHQWEVGVGEMALGASLIAWGVQSGAIQLGIDIVGTAFGDHVSGGAIGSGIGAAAGAIGSSILGSIGVAAVGTAIAIPAAVVIVGGTLILSAVGYSVGDLAQKYLSSAPDWATVGAGASALLVGLALLIDGARRVARDPDVLRLASRIKVDFIELVETNAPVVARTFDDLKAIMDSMAKLPQDKIDLSGSAISGAGGALGGAAIGGSIAAGSITVLGSSTLGSAAVSLGLVSAPIWPVVAAGAAGLAIGYTVWKTIRFIGVKNRGTQGEEPCSGSQ